MDVTVIMLTYNHQPYIAQAIESVLAQRTQATFELIISEDHSTDATRQIVTEYAQRDPERIRLLLSAKNQNDMDVYSRAYESATGEFVAYLDGDDYWMPDKLERQVRFLRDHPDCPMCFHAVQVVGDLPQGMDYDRIGHHGDWLTIGGMVDYNHVPSCSPLFRRAALGLLPDWFDELPYCDWPIALLMAEQGDIGYIDVTLGAYRQHAGGVWSSAPAYQQAQWDVTFFLAMRDRLERPNRVHASKGLALARSRSILANGLASGRRGAVQEFAASCRDVRGWDDVRYMHAPCKSLLRAVAPTLHGHLGSVARGARRTWRRLGGRRAG